MKINTTKNMKRSKLLAYTAVVLLTGVTTYAQDKNSDIDKVFSWTKPTEPGCVCAISQNGKIVANRAYGAADLECDAPINTNSIFDAGSVSKQFIAAAGLLL